MKDLLKVMLVLALVFISTFIIIKVTGLFTLDDIISLAKQALQIHPIVLAMVIIGLLFADLFIAIPTMTVSILAGYFLGWPLGAATTLVGFYLAGVTGYWISRVYGWRLLNHLINDHKRLTEMHDIYSSYGPIVLIICRALPILPEVSCCMAGATRMPVSKFLGMYSLGSVPYALITTYAGSISTLEKPIPAIIAVIGISLILWLVWLVLGRRIKVKRGGNKNVHS